MILFSPSCKHVEGSEEFSKHRNIESIDIMKLMRRKKIARVENFVLSSLMAVERM